MPKRPVSVTLDENNLLWLRGRMARRKRRSLSDAIDEVITAVVSTDSPTVQLNALIDRFDGRQGAVLRGRPFRLCTPGPMQASCRRGKA